MSNQGKPPDSTEEGPSQETTVRPSSPARSDYTARSDRSKGEPPNLGNEEPRPPSPALSYTSTKTDKSKEENPNFSNEESSQEIVERPSSPARSDYTARSDRSKGEPPNLGNEEPRPPSPALSYTSTKTDKSKEENPNFSNEESSQEIVERPPSPALSYTSTKTDRSKGEPPNFSNEESSQEIVERPSSPARSDYTARSDRSKGEPPNFRHEELSRPKERTSLDDPLDFKKDLVISPQDRVISAWKKEIKTQYENSLLDMKATSQLFEFKNKKPIQIQSYNNLFQDDRFFGEKRRRTVLTKGETGIGKTLYTQKFMVDWAKGNSNSSIDLVIPLHFSKLNARDGVESMEDLLNHSLNNVKPSGMKICDLSLAFVLDGLEQCRLPLDFEHNKKLADATEPASIDVLLTNLIKGDLLPSALVWIITGPSGVDKIPAKYIKKVTECRDPNVIRKLTKEAQKRVLANYEMDVKTVKVDSKLYEIVNEKEVEQTSKDIFMDFKKKQVRTVLTKGVVGVGKTFQMKKLLVDWAKGKSNQNIDLIVPLCFRELNLKGDKILSMEDLLSYSMENLNQKEKEICLFECKLVFVLDHLEECKCSLDFESNRILSNVKERASMDVLLTNLVKGTLLPTACLWIISHTSEAEKIPPEYIGKVTECRETLTRRKLLVAKMKERFRKEYNQVEDPDHHNQKNTEHILREHTTGEDTDNGKTDKQEIPKKMTQVTVFDLFKAGEEKNFRNLLTIGEAGIGKSFQMQKFIKFWAENKNNHYSLSLDINWGKRFFGKSQGVVEVIFPLDLSKMDLMKTQQISLMGLLNHFFPEIKQLVISDFSKFKLMFALDGLDAFKQPLDFDNKVILTDIREPASVDVILTNLIRGDLLPSAMVWITSRPSTPKQQLENYVQRLTEIREKPSFTSKRKVKCQLKEQFTYVSQGADQQNTSALLKEIYTDLYIIEGERGEVNSQHECRQVQDARSARQEIPIKYCDIFKPSSDEDIPIKSVLTTGVAGIGKTFASMKYMLDWTEELAGENIDYTFPLPFRELNLRIEQEHSLEELIHQFFPAMKSSEITNYDKFKILIVLDGLDECRFELNFNDSRHLTDVKEQTSMSVLLTNLIQGNLLPEAQIWITSRPAASNIIPPSKVNRVTEVRGFNDKQKEEYFRKRFIDKDLAEKILSHVKKSRSLFIMCYIPIFCWITSKVMEIIVTQKQKDTMPKTLTDMYTLFLLEECKQANVKYHETETAETAESCDDSCWNTKTKETILSLGKLAFEELDKGNFLFTQEHLNDCGINITNAAVYSGLFTQIKREGCGLYQQKLFCFVHVSIQEFLAAFHVSHTFTNTGENLFTVPTKTESVPTKTESDMSTAEFYQKAVDKTLESKNGDWDLFLRFLLGLSLESNQDRLKDLLKTAENNKESYQETVDYIKKKIDEEVRDADQNLNLFHCLNELNDLSLVAEVKKSLQSETKAFEKFSNSQWSALTFVLLTSDANLDVFDLKKYLKSEKVLLGMLPVVKVSKTALLSWCDLSEKSCLGLTASVLSSASTNLTELDLSHNDLFDSGVQQLSEGLQNVHCKLEILKLAGCQVTEKGCSYLASALEKNAACHLTELDLSYNHPGESGVAKLSALAEKPTVKLKTLCVDYPGEHRLRSGLEKFDGLLRLDENTAGKRLRLMEGNKKVETLSDFTERVAHPDHDDRFQRTQVLCDEGQKGYCYWEVEWEGTVGIAVAYKKVGRKGDSSGGLGCNENSWSLICTKKGFMSRSGETITGYRAMHNGQSEYVREAPCQKIAVFLDWKGGTLSYYSVSSGERTLIHTFHAEFEDLLFPGFWFENGSVTLCDLG